jgi:isopentenyl phosphate kinase
MKELYVIKLGGSLLSDKRLGTVFDERISSTGRVVAELAKRFRLIIVVGGGAIGHSCARRLEVDKGLAACNREELYTFAVRMFELKGRVAAAISTRETAALPFHEMSVVNIDSAGIGLYSRPIATALEQGVVPVLSGGLVFDPARGIRPLNGDLLGMALHRSEIGPVRRVIMLADVAGVLNDREDVIPTISPADSETTRRYVRTIAQYDVTGGMGSKLDAALALAADGVETVISSGVGIDEARLEALIHGVVCNGTRVVPQ